ncbi:hypothetical protein [Chitinophaga rhizosphaerae]|uniref:hypothetical protein n=1 Tax=Chitinophaga rhizosphaerae TaxID=1864947 RepID=UPI000F803024|nr:hypothetical protein [Chitinophaga rhizosphaerae]
MILADEIASFLHVSGSGEDLNGTEDWLFRKDSQEGTEKVLHRNGDIALKIFQVQLNFGIDVDNFPCCLG